LWPLSDFLRLLRRSRSSSPVFDADKRGIAFARLIAEPGRREFAKQKDGDLEVEFGVMIAKAGNTAEAKVTISRAGTVVMRQTATFRLMNVSDKKYVPLQ
jgi:hypothetical protein